MALLIALSIFMLFPFFWLIRSALMTDREIMSMPMQWFPAEFKFSNYVEAMQRAPFLRYFLNSMILVVTNVAGHVLSASFVAFGFARFKFPGKKLWFSLILSTLMIPYTVLMIPQFILWQSVGAYNSYWPLILPAFFGSAFNIFLVLQFYRGIPMDYDEAAVVDGANYFRIYSTIILPMAKPVLMSVGVFTFMNTWNDFMGPLLYTGSWNLLMAASSVAIIPMLIIFFFAQRYFIEGITFSGLKG
jgi:multiple sugar transport system permease protein